MARDPDSPQNALVALTNTVLSTVRGDPVNDPYPIDFAIVHRNPLNEQAWAKRLLVGIYDSAEDVKDGANQREYLLHVAPDSRRMLDAGEVATMAGDAVLGIIQRKIGEDRTLGGTVIDIIEARSYQALCG